MKFETDQDRFLGFLDDASWGAGKYLAKRLRDGSFHDQLGESAQLYFLLDSTAVSDETVSGDEASQLKNQENGGLTGAQKNQIAGFCALVEQDFNPVPQFRPFLAFAYVDPAYRGQGLLAKMLSFLEDEAKAAGWRQVYIITRHFGLYERYGYQHIQDVESPIHGTDYLYTKTLVNKD